MHWKDTDTHTHKCFDGQIKHSYVSDHCKLYDSTGGFKMQVTIFVECHENNSRIQYPYNKDK